MRGNKESDAAGKQDGSEDERDAALPSHPSDLDLSLGTPEPQARWLPLFGFIGADAGGGISVEDTGGLPAFKQRFEVGHDGWATLEHSLGKSGGDYGSAELAGLAVLAGLRIGQRIYDRD